MPFRHPRRRTWLACLILLGLAACQPAVPTPLPATSTSLVPTATQVPMAVTVNGSGITQAEFEAELSRFQAAQSALGNQVPLADASQRVLDDLIDQVLLEQGAAEAGYSVDDAALQTRMDNLVASLGNIQALVDWEKAHGYDDASLRVALRRQMAAAWMRDKIISAVPETADQVHVQQILLRTAEEAKNVLEELQAGSTFADLAAVNDPLTHGELGWFPRNYLPYPQIEQAAFALKPGEYSAAIETPAGFSILYLVERDPSHRLSPDALLTLQSLALKNWLANRRQSATITLAP